ncbi:alpha/beta fold hydrolase [Actinopolymorpha cephalotaxi]|uniref:alpha/beta fold hydrolase n=1 Tax=Actinopolymorpha cephalotaxi TaxID=504797 RepID=UPI000B8720B8
MPTSAVDPVRDLVVGDGSVPIAVRDFGGDGRPLVLLHGAGGNLAHWTSFAPLLAPDFRVVAPDLRGHGHSANGPWTWTDVLTDVQAVVDHLGLANPVVVGHSLGGYVAARWGRTHPDCPAIVDLDGFRSAETGRDNYPGMDPRAARPRPRHPLPALRRPGEDDGRTARTEAGGSAARPTGRHDDRAGSAGRTGDRGVRPEPGGARRSDLPPTGGGDRAGDPVTAAGRRPAGDAARGALPHPALRGDRRPPVPTGGR